MYPKSIRLRARYSYDAHTTIPPDDPLRASRYDVRHGDRNLGWVKRAGARSWVAYKTGFWDVRDLGQFSSRSAAVAAVVAGENLQGSAR